jgi:hypothetical protein
MRPDSGVLRARSSAKAPAGRPTEVSITHPSPAARTRRALDWDTLDLSHKKSGHEDGDGELEHRKRCDCKGWGDLGAWDILAFAHARFISSFQHPASGCESWTVDAQV